MGEVSVIVATYNGEKFLREQIDSILNQTRLPAAIITSDDQSTDHTATLLFCAVDFWD